MPKKNIPPTKPRKTKGGWRGHQGKTSFQIRLDTDLYEWLQEIAAYNRTSITYVLTRLILGAHNSWKADSSDACPVELPPAL